MNISTRGRYGTRAMLSLAARYGQGFISANEISKEQDVSLKYLENILRSLKANDLVLSTKGVRGGYALAKAPQKINLQEILVALGEDLDIVFCTAGEDLCQRSDMCVTREIWSEIHESVNRILSTTTLADLQTRLAIRAIKNTAHENAENFGSAS